MLTDNFLCKLTAGQEILCILWKRKVLPIKLPSLLPVLSPASLRFTLILSSNASGLLASGFRTKTQYVFLFSAMHFTSATHLILHLVTLIMLGGYRLPYPSYPCRYEMC